MHKETYYKKLRDKFLPEKLKVVFVLESPPLSGKYFYDPKGNKNEYLFKIMMKFIDYEPEDKANGLKEFSKKGYLLVDSTYNQINGIKKPKDRNREIVTNIPNLVNDLEKIVKNKGVKIIPIKKNVCIILSEVLKSIGFKVLNQDIPFPDPSQVKIFFEKLNYLKRQYKLP